MIEPFSCFIIDVIKNTLAMCDYRLCTDTCTKYLWEVASECPVVFNNDMYNRLWTTLFTLCFSEQKGN